VGGGPSKKVEENVKLCLKVTRREHLLGKGGEYMVATVQTEKLRENRQVYVAGETGRGR